MLKLDTKRIQEILEKLERAEVAGAMAEIEEYAKELANSDPEVKTIAKDIMGGKGNVSTQRELLEVHQRKWSNMVIEEVRKLNQGPKRGPNIID